MALAPELLYLVYLVVLAWTLRLPLRRRIEITAVSGADALFVWWVSTQSGPAFDVVRDWLPLAQILVCYWMSGLFFQRPMAAAERWLAAGDRWLFRTLSLLRAVARAPRWVLEALELAYLSVYFVLPLGFAVALWLDPDLDSRRYWTVILVAELACYGVLPWVQTRPPRALGDHPAIDAREVAIRRLNGLVLRHGSIQVNTFPSGHAAGALATAFAVGSLSPAAGAIFGVVAAGIVIGSVVGRYHYAIDSAAGLAVAALAWIALR